MLNQNIIESLPTGAKYLNSFGLHDLTFRDFSILECVPDNVPFHDQNIRPLLAVRDFEMGKLFKTGS